MWVDAYYDIISSLHKKLNKKNSQNLTCKLQNIKRGHDKNKKVKSVKIDQTKCYQSMEKV